MIKFIYSSDKYDRNRELVVDNIFRIMSTLIELPANIEVEFRVLPESVYGETLIDNRYKNRIRLQESLSPKEVIVPLIHELIHLNQTYTGKLSGRRDGSFVWNKKVYHAPKTPSLEEWSKLPWEIDVAEKEKTILAEVLNKAGILTNT
jgi:hypothetical protein